MLFDILIAENVRYGALFCEVSDEQVIEATKTANIHSFVESLPRSDCSGQSQRGSVWIKLSLQLCSMVVCCDQFNSYSYIYCVTIK